MRDYARDVRHALRSLRRNPGLTAFALLSLLFASIGIYGVMRQATAARTREIGIRMAVGARPADVSRLVVRQGMTITLAGFAIGLVAAAMLSRLMAGILFGVDALDPLAFAAASAVLLVVALLASYLPARRAARVDPTVALRAE